MASIYIDMLQNIFRILHTKRPNIQSVQMRLSLEEVRVWLNNYMTGKVMKLPPQ